MEFLQPYGIYLIVIGGVLVLAGMVMGYLSVLPTPTKSVELPETIGSNGHVTMNAGSQTAMNPPQNEIPQADVAQQVSPQASPNAVISPANTVATASSNLQSEAQAPGESQKNTAQQITGTIDLAAMEQLERLMSLLERGVITKDEFDALKQNILTKKG